MLKNIIAVLIMSGYLWFSLSKADDAIGFVKIVNGEAEITTAEGTISVQPGMAVYLGNILKTGEDGSLGITFKDNTVMSLGQNTELRIDEYVFAPAKGDLKLLASLAKGTLQYISGVIAKLKPNAVSVKTPVGIIGVRGTRFLVKAEAE